MTWGDFIIALFYSGDLSIKYLLLMLLAFVILIIINKFNIKKFLPYLVIGLFFGTLHITQAYMLQ